MFPFCFVFYVKPIFLYFSGLFIFIVIVFFVPVLIYGAVCKNNYIYREFCG